MNENMFRRWTKELAADPVQTFPGHGKERPDWAEVEKLRREIAKLWAERGIPKGAAAYFPAIELVLSAPYFRFDELMTAMQANDHLPASCARPATIELRP